MIKLDYSLDSPQERNELVKKILEENPDPGEKYLEVCETTNGIKTYKVREYDVNGSVSYYDVDVANDTYKFQEYYAKGTVQDNLNSESTVYALSARQGKVLNGKIGQIETVLQTITTGNGV